MKLGHRNRREFIDPKVSAGIGTESIEAGESEGRERAEIVEGVAAIWVGEKPVGVDGEFQKLTPRQLLQALARDECQPVDGRFGADIRLSWNAKRFRRD